MTNKRNYYEPHERTLKLGYIREDGKMFLSYNKGRETWTTPEKYEEMKRKAKDRANAAYKKDPDKLKAKVKEYAKRNQEKIQEYRDSTKEEKRRYNREYGQKHKEWMSERSKIYKENNPERHKKWRIKEREKRKLRLKTDDIYRLKNNLRQTIRRAFKKKGFKKSKRAEEILGCPINYFKTWMEQQFTEGMTLENYGEWDIEHIIPVNYGKTKEEIEILNHHLNLRPMWGSENSKKGHSVPDNVDELFEKLKAAAKTATFVHPEKE